MLTDLSRLRELRARLRALTDDLDYEITRVELVEAAERPPTLTIELRQAPVVRHPPPDAEALAAVAARPGPAEHGP